MVEKAKAPIVATQPPPKRVEGGQAPVVRTKDETVAVANPNGYTKAAPRLDKPEAPVVRGIHADAAAYTSKMKKKDPVQAAFELVKAKWEEGGNSQVGIGEKLAQLVMSINV